MTEDLDNIAYCQSCNCAMDVTMLAPFTNVKCPECHQHNRVKIDVGAYVLKKREGVGGMSLVFGAVDKTLGREVAIKILNEVYSMDEKRIEQFEQEARITAAISHPHIVKVFTVGQAFKRFFIAMELVAGGSLEQKMADSGAMSEQSILVWAQQIADGLSAANDAGLIHRDIKPGNILFDKDGHVKIVDFGLALVTQGGKAQADEIWATPYYVPPEALDVLEEDFRSDIYALGASLFHALSGKPPFSSETRSTTELKEIKRKLPSLKVFAPWLNDETCAVIDKAMAFNMNDRFSSYRELIDALYYAEMVVENNGERPPNQAGNNGRSRGAKNVGMLVGMGIAALALIGGGIYLSGSAEEEVSNVGQIVKPPVLAPAQDSESEVSKRVAIEISAARSSLKDKNYDDAYKRYAALAEDDNVQPDTVYWAGLQAATVAWLDGKPKEARQMLTYLSQKHQKEGSTGSETGRRLELAVNSLTEYGKVGADSIPEMQNEIDVMIVIASALKNWTSGHIGESQKLFKMAKAFSVQDASEELVFYLNRVSDYKHDLNLLDSYRNDFKATTLEEIRSRRSELEQTAKKLKTQGRAKFDIEEWNYQLDIQRRRIEREVIARNEKDKLLAEQNKQANDLRAAWADFYAEISEDLENAEFTKPWKRLELKKFENNKDSQRKEQLIYLCNMANGYKSTLKRTLSNSRTNARIELKASANVYTAIFGAEDEGLVVMENGIKKVLRWNEIKPSSLVELHRFNILGELSQFEKNLRLEQAVAFAWLTGEQEIARTGAQSLMQQNEIFKLRWKLCMELLDS